MHYGIISGASQDFKHLMLGSPASLFAVNPVSRDNVVEAWSQPNTRNCNGGHIFVRAVSAGLT